MSAEPLGAPFVRLNGGLFADARARNADYLLMLEPDRLLYGFRRNAGLDPRGAIYGGWESASLGGHTLGHYLSAIARLAAADDADFLARLVYVLRELETCQSARPDRFLGGMPDADRVFGELRAGQVRSRGFDLNDCWVPWYNLHKLLAGLLDAALCGGRGDALTIATRMGDWVGDVTAGLDDAQWQTMLACEFGGMNESLANLADATGQERFLELARKFDHRVVLDPLADGQDRLAGLHANTQIPKILGCARLYELTGEERYRRIVENFWRFVIEDHSYCIGGHGSREHFGPPGQLSAHLSATNCECCNTYNLLKLSRHLFAWEPRAALAQWAERALYNHILASQHPETGMLAYFVPLHAAGFRTYSTPFDSFWCCVGSGIESHARHEEYVAVGDAADQTLYINLHTPATIRWDDGFLHQETDFPDTPSTTLRWSGPPTRLTVAVRDGAGGFRRESRVWREGDSWEMPLPRERHDEGLPDAPRRVATIDGPLVLAADLGPAPVADHENPGEAPDAQIPSVPVRIDGAFDRPTTLAPFFRLHGRRYAVYLDGFTREEWSAQEDAYRAAERADHARRTQKVDEFWPAQMQPERDHDFAGEQAPAGEISAWKCRHVEPGGWLSFTLRCLPDVPQEIFCKWGPPPEGVAPVRFTLEADGLPLATVEIEPGPHRHIDQTYPLPDTVTAGRSRITVRLAAPHGTRSAPLFLCGVQKRLAT